MLGLPTPYRIPRQYYLIVSPKPIVAIYPKPIVAVYPKPIAAIYPKPTTVL